MSSDVETWIETTSYQDGKRTLWVVRHRSEIVKAGEVHDDPSGVRAFDHALLWAKEQLGRIAVDWKHVHVRSNADATLPDRRWGS